MKYLLLFTLVTFMLACQPAEDTKEVSSDNGAQANEAPSSDAGYALPIVETISRTHNAQAFHDKKAVAFNLELYFGGSKRFESRITSNTNSTAIRFDRSDGVSLIYDGEKVVQTPDTTDYPGARFDIFTWQYFALAPFKFDDPGTNWKQMDTVMMDGRSYDRARLTFENGTGDAPDDWYVVYQDEKSDRLHGMAYIVTFGKSKEKAEQEPHAITYHNYQSVDGIPFPTQWKFWLWSEKDGFGQQIGSAELANISFVDDPDYSASGATKEIKR